MITILHGNDVLASRKALTDHKLQSRGKGKELIDLLAKDIQLTILKQALESSSLFGQDKLVIIEGVFSLPQSQNRAKIINYLKQTNFEPDLLIWENKQIDGRILKSFTPKARIHLFKLPVLIFKFLDSLQPGNYRVSLNLLHQILKKEPVALIFYMLIRQIRYLLIAKDLGKNGLADFAPWQQANYLLQADKFSLEQLLKIYQKFLQIDFQQKTGQSDLSLKSTLDLLILDL